MRKLCVRLIIGTYQPEVLQTPHNNGANDELHTSIRRAIIGLIARRTVGRFV